MSGHSKWAGIKHKKAIVDAKRGKLFSKLSAQISLAAKTGSNPEMNPSLRMAVERAKAAGMTKENIERAIKRGSGESGGVALEEVQYEAFGPAGAAFLIQVITDNKNRALSEIKAVLNHGGGSLAGGGAVSHLFTRMGKIEAKEDKEGKEDLELKTIESGADDYEFEDGRFLVYTSPANMEAVKKFLENKKITIETSELVMKPNGLVSLDEGQKEKISTLRQNLEDIPDVSEVFCNAEI